VVVLEVVVLEALAGLSLAQLQGVTEGQEQVHTPLGLLQHLLV
jgi:hypothetical protein